MRKLLLIFVSLFLACISFAQSNEVTSVSHLKFKGIPINGTPDEFGAKLQQAGFSFYFQIDDGSKWYKGNFAGYNNCDVVVKANGELVYEIVVLFPEDYSWGQLYNTYSSIKDMLTTKYGEPLFCKEKFENTPSYINIDDDNDKFSEVKDNHCRYYTAFATMKDGLGNIYLEIKSTGRVGLHYTDFLNNLNSATL